MHEKSSNQKVGSEMMVRWLAESAQLSGGTPDGSDMHIFVDSKATWFTITDDQPQLKEHATAGTQGSAI